MQMQLLANTSVAAMWRHIPWMVILRIMCEEREGDQFEHEEEWGAEDEQLGGSRTASATMHSC